MAIRDWHTGQLVIFWVVVAAVQFVLWQVATVGPDLSTGGVVAMTVALVSLPVAALIVTWKWFRGRRES